MNTNQLFAAAKAAPMINRNKPNPNAVAGVKRFTSYAEIIGGIAEQAIKDGTGVVGFLEGMDGSQKHGFIWSDLKARLEFAIRC